MESLTSTGLAVVSRAAFSRGDEPAETTADVAAESGAEVSVVDSVPPSGPIRPQRWPSWPGDWGDPVWSNWWGRVEDLSDTAWACTDTNASVLSSMPPYLVNAAPSLDADWMVNPDPLIYASWAAFAKELFWDYQHGEAFVLATDWYVTGWPSRFHVVPPWMVRVEFDRDGLRRYWIGALDVTDRILHIPYRSTTRMERGQGPLEVGRGRIIAANALTRYVTELAAAGGIPYAVLIHPGRLTAKQAADLQWQWVGSRIAAMGLPGVLSGGVELKTLSVDPEKMGMLDLSRYTDARIATLMGVPPPLVALPSGQDSLTYNTATMIRDQHWQLGLKPKVTAVMSALSGWALPRGTAIELDRDEYVRPGPLERAQTAEIYLRNGVLSVEEVRDDERFSTAEPARTLTGVMS